MHTHLRLVSEAVGNPGILDHVVMPLPDSRCTIRATKPGSDFNSKYVVTYVQSP
jgi:hypothetical protein